MRSATQLFRRVHPVIIILLLILNLVIFAINPPVAAKAAAALQTGEVPETKCSHINVIMLIDHSKSMEINDPLELRYSAPVDMANKLAIGYQQAFANLKPDEKPMTIMLSVVWFASNAKITLDWTQINPADSKAKDALLQQIRQKLTLDDSGQEALNDEIGTHTNFINAFQKAQLLANAMEAPVNGCPEHVILLMTDGGPDTQNNPELPSDYEWHFSEVQKIVNDSFSGQGNSIYITGINNTTEEWSHFNKYWKKVTGIESTNKNDPAPTDNVVTKSGVGFRLDAIINKIFDAFVVKVFPGPYTVPPYIDLLVLTFFKSEKTDVLIFTDPSGNPMDPSRTDVQVVSAGDNEGIQSLEIYRPAPGIYTLGTTARSNDFAITAKTIFITARLAAPDGAVQQLTTTPIQINLLDSGGNPLPNYGNEYKLQAKATLTGPSNYLGDLTMVHEMANSQLSSAFTPIWDGIYHMVVSATANDANGKSVVILDPTLLSFDLLVEPVKLHVNAIEKSQPTCSVGQHSQVTIPFHLTNAATNQTAKVTAPITWDATALPGDSLSIEPANVDGIYKIHASPSQAGEWVVNLKGTVVDPLDQVSTYAVFEGSSTANVMPTVQVGFDLDAIGTQPSGFHSMLEQFLAKITGQDPTIPMVINRSLGFNQAPITIHAKLTDLKTSAGINQLSLLSTPQLLRQDGKKVTITAETWQPDSNGSGFIYTMRADRGGFYHLKLDEVSVDCGTVLVVKPFQNQILLVPDLPTRILTLLGLLLGLAVIILVIILLVCRFANPQYHHVDIDDSSYNPIPGHQWIMSDTSCWSQKETGTPEVGEIYYIKICSVFSKKGEYTITIRYNDIQGKKQEIKKTQCHDGDRLLLNMVSVYVYLNR